MSTKIEIQEVFLALQTMLLQARLGDFAEEHLTWSYIKLKSEVEDD
jgi:hypothetical protein